MNERYGKVFAVNLLSRKKPHEVILTENFENFVKNSNFEFLRYEFFDFHEECKGSKFSNLNPLTRRLGQCNF